MRRIQIFPTMGQKRLLALTFDACRHVYNKTVEAINSGEESTRKALRAATVNDEVWKKVMTDEAWKVVPYEIRDGAMLDAFKAAKSTKASLKARGIETKHWKFKFRHKKDPTESITIRKRQLNRKTGKDKYWSKLFGYSKHRDVMCSKRPLPGDFDHDIRLWHHRVLGIYYLVVPETCPAGVLHPDTQGNKAAAVVTEKKSVVAIDPGVRTFATCYDPEGTAIKWGCEGEDGTPSANNKLWRIANQIQSLRTRMGKHTILHRKRYRMRRAAFRLDMRVRHMVDELHHKLARWLCTNYEAVILPEFRVSGMVEKRNSKRKWKRKIAKKTVRQLYSLSQCRFREFLKHKAGELGSSLAIVSERYTTMTCGSCGLLNVVGGSEVYRCRFCGYIADRDINASRNILLKYISDNSIDIVDKSHPPSLEGGGGAMLQASCLQGQ